MSSLRFYSLEPSTQSIGGEHGRQGNIRWIDSEEADAKPIYFYTHWDGTELPTTLQNVLAKKLRWDDEAYLARMVFSAMVHSDIDGETGYGISTYICDQDHAIITVNARKKLVEINGHIWSYEEYIKLSEDELAKVYLR